MSPGPISFGPGDCPGSGVTLEILYMHKPSSKNAPKINIESQSWPIYGFFRFWIEVEVQWMAPVQKYTLFQGEKKKHVRVEAKHRIPILFWRRVSHLLRNLGKKACCQHSPFAIPVIFRSLPLRLRADLGPEHPANGLLHRSTLSRPNGRATSDSPPPIVLSPMSAQTLKYPSVQCNSPLCTPPPHDLIRQMQDF